ncbi:MAG TPA: hypothetical protein VM532_13480 [Burkholderiales bacterium]|nr:hypothetical protein [Burkholderiales bacterium]
MKRSPVIPGWLVMLLLISMVAHAGRIFAACPKSLKGGTSWFDSSTLVTYDGNIGHVLAVRLTLTFNNDSLSGKYFYVKTLRDIRVKGAVLGDRSFTLEEYDKNGLVVARFKGTFPEEDPKASYGEGNKLQCEVMIGVWEQISPKRSFPFYLKLNYAISGTLDDRYASAMAKPNNDEASIERLAQRFLTAVHTNDRKQVAAVVHYPFSAYRPGKGPYVIKNRKEFLANYDEIISEQYKEDLKRAIPKHMFMDKHNFIMLGERGFPWIGSDSKIWLFGAN